MVQSRVQSTRCPGFTARLPMVVPRLWLAQEAGGEGFEGVEKAGQAETELRETGRREAGIGGFGHHFRGL